MKKFLVSLLLVLALFVFAGEATFSQGTKISFSGTATFELVVDSKGIDISGTAPLDATVSLSLSPTSVTSAGVTFGLTYGYPSSGTSIGVNFSLRTISFKTPYFDALYSVPKIFVSDYFTGRIYNADGTVTWTGSAFNADFSDTLKLTFPTIAGLEVYYIDRKDPEPSNDAYFSDMVLVKYPIAGFNVVGGIYRTSTLPTTHEFGAEVKGKLDLGFFKPDLTVFGGMVAGASGMETAYDFILSGSLTPVAGLEIKPTVKFAENITELDYMSNNILGDKYVQAAVTYSQAFGPVTPKVKVTPKYNFSSSKLTLPLDELSVKAVFAPITLYVKTNNSDVLDNTKKYELYAQGDLAVEMFSLTAKAFWKDVTTLNVFDYIHVQATAKVDVLTLTGNYRMTTTKNGYNVSASYQLTSNVRLTGFFGTLTGDDSAGWTFLTEPTWNAKLVYSVKF
ncbi:MAG: hypothetical protein N2Z58_02580 [Fervidobacterium sp.]|nr:hypothetical protein [Fervidobacterium sp.]